MLLLSVPLTPSPLRSPGFWGSRLVLRLIPSSVTPLLLVPRSSMRVALGLVAVSQPPTSSPLQKSARHFGRCRGTTPVRSLVATSRCLSTLTPTTTWRATQPLSTPRCTHRLAETRTPCGLVRWPDSLGSPLSCPLRLLSLRLLVQAVLMFMHP